ncbi:hypothetical protein, partial [Escherichia coli]|uniref:hypothetical protein n=1 Tax=Escherichia coli TaxID=562 RepID=UPI001F16BB47
MTSKGSTSDSQVRVKESIKENKETSFFTAEENAQNEAKMKAILEAERQAQEAQTAGKAWRGRELLAPEHLVYGD